jgi:DNA-binding Lrp family transcriptional regulator
MLICGTRARACLMPKAFVFATVDAGAENDVVKRLREIRAVKEAYSVYGVYDVVAEVETESMESLKEVITTRIRGLDKVRSTLTTMCVEGK